MDAGTTDRLVIPVMRGGLLALNKTSLVFHVGLERRPEFQLQLLVLGFSATGGLLDRAGPVVGLADDVELGGEGRIADLPQFDFQAKRIDFLVGMLVQPIQRGAVFVGKALGDPDDGDGLQARRVGDQLAQVGMVGALQLVFDEHPIVVGRVFAKNVCAKRADVLFLRFQFQIDADCFAQ